MTVIWSVFHINPFERADELLYGDEDQNELMNLIKDHKDEEGEERMNDIQKISADIEAYKQAIEDARNALATAENELDEALEAELNG